MKCFSCQESELLPVKLEPGLPALGCNDCGGVYIDLLTYREWNEDQDSDGAGSPSTESSTIAEEPADSDKALICQRCRKIMLKFKISGKTDNYVDLCATCDDAWLDHGEWQMLNQLQLEGKLTEIVTRPWQKQIREDRAASSLENRFRDALGADDYTRAREYADWMTAHPKRREIENLVRYIRRG
ncbi:MAG: hypothetical protein KTR32_01955 [Granulosicoccus sp.]|nr:hypothetical protein [Granulosicoccus sp.]